jgi:N-acyl homoserine lactone hydrolase
MTGQESTPGVELSVIRTGVIPAPYGYVYRAVGTALSRLRSLTGRGDRLALPCLAFVVRHPEAGLILIDTGFHEDARTSPRKDFGVPMGLLFRSLRAADQPFDRQLRDLSIEPGEVRRVIMTHLHVDHTSGMRLLPNAQFTISRAEWRAAHGRFAASRGVVNRHLPGENRVELVDPEREGEPFGPFRHTLDPLGDGTVRLVSTPGHTKGHMSVLLRLIDGRRLLLVGDAAYTIRSIREGILPMLTDSDEESRRSLEQLRTFMDEDPDAIVIPTHDPGAWLSRARVRV